MSGALFWIAVAFVVWVYALFPAVLWLRSRLLVRPALAGGATPSVSLVICAHNEARGIGAKLENIRSLDYPRERLEVIIASDGSTDGTEEVVRSDGDPRVRLLALPRLGKIPALNAAVAKARGEILVFSDANSMYDAGALRALVRWFADSRVGGVAGDQRYTRGVGAEGDGGQGERTYWDLDRKLKQWQSRSGSVTSATGAIYAIRRTLYCDVPSGVTDDFWISTNVIAQGRRLVFEREAVAREPVAPSSGLEFRRKVRVMTRGLRGLWLMRGLLDPQRHGFYALQLLSHKVMRRLVFVPLAALLLASALRWESGAFYRTALFAQVAFYGAAAIGARLPPERRPRALALPLYFCMVNAASAVAVSNIVRGRKIDRWDPQREGVGEGASANVPGGRAA